MTMFSLPSRGRVLIGSPRKSASHGLMYSLTRPARGPGEIVFHLVVRRERQRADPELQRPHLVERRYEMGADDVDGAGREPALRNEHDLLLVARDLLTKAVDSTSSEKSK